MSEPAVKVPDVFNATTAFVDKHISEGRGSKVAIHYEGQQITYQQVFEGVNRVGNFLRQLGVEMENRVLLLLLDCPEFAYSFFGAIKIGAVPIPTNTLMKPQDYLYFLNDSRAKVTIVSESLVGNLEAVRGELKYLKHLVVVGNAGPNQFSFESLFDASSPELEAVETSKDDAAFWLYSSGTTGFPKGTVHLHHDMVVCAELYGKGVLGITENDLTYSVAKLFFAYGLGNGLYFPFYVGASTVLNPHRPEPQRIFETIDKDKPTLFFCVPTAYAGLLALEGAERKYDLSSIRQAVSAGEALPKALYERWKERFKSEILDGIGSTEILHIFISNRPGQSRPGSSGQVVPGYQAKIVDENGNPVPDGQVGSLWISGDSIALMYWNKHEKTKDTIAGHWINTGDKYYRDAGGYFYYVGRQDDMLKAGGIWVSPVEVEACLMEHPAVLEVGVVGERDSDNLDKPVAYIKLREGCAPSEELVKEFQDFVKGRLAPYKYPRWIRFIDELPKTATGKIQRFKLRQLAAEPAGH